MRPRTMKLKDIHAELRVIIEEKHHQEEMMRNSYHLMAHVLTKTRAPKIELLKQAASSGTTEQDTNP